MNQLVQRRLLQRELELMSAFALEIDSVLRSGSIDERLTWLQGLLATSLKLSRLLWPFGRRAGDDLAVEVAAALRDQLEIREDHPLAPERTPPLAAALRLTPDELRGVVDFDQELLTLGGAAFPLQRLVSAIRTVYQAVKVGEPRPDSLVPHL